MGTRITAKGVDAEAYATEMGVPVRTGIRGIFLLNTNKDKIVWNYAPGSAGKGSIFGNPVVTPQYTETDGLMGGDPRYVDTGVIETNAFTYFYIAKIDPTAPGFAAPGVSQPSELRSMFVSNYGPPSMGYGVGLYVSRGNAVACTLGTADGGGNVQSSTQHLVVDFTKYLIVSCKYDLAARSFTLKNHISGAVIVMPTADGFTRATTGRTMRIGAANTDGYGGKAHMVAVQLHDVALSDSDIDKNAAFLKAYAQRKGIAF